MARIRDFGADCLQLAQSERWKRENSRCRVCQVKAYPEELDGSLCASCIAELRAEGRWCEQHGPLPVRVRWIDRRRDQFELVIEPCRSCVVAEVA